MDTPNYNAQTAHGETILMPRTDFFKLPDYLRSVSDGVVKVLASVGGHQQFIPVRLI